MNIIKTQKTQWYYCGELGCRLYYVPKWLQTKPVVKIKVSCPSFGSDVLISLLGVGEAGENEFSWLPYFPVDLHNTPHKLDPHLSQTCNQQMMDDWERLVLLKSRKQWQR